MIKKPKKIIVHSMMGQTKIYSIKEETIVEEETIAVLADGRVVNAEELYCGDDREWGRQNEGQEDV